MRTLALAAAALAVACSPGGDAFDYPRDDVLAFQHVQAKGTHNSYHVESADNQVPEWEYTHEPLAVQLADQGVRQVELDVNIDPFEERFEVYHVLRIDQETTCALLTDCLVDMKRWSDDNPAHHPITVMVELKDGFDPAYADRFFEILEAEILSVWPRRRIVTPDDIRGDHATIADALAADGWPTLGALRGTIAFFLLDRGEFRSVYTHGDTSLDGRLAFVTVALGAPYAAITNIDDPIADGAAITAAVEANMLIRTRIDGEQSDTGPAVDPERMNAAFAAGAHFLSTDAPATELPEGSPSRCNPVTAPPACLATDIEDPAFLD